ncbi:MAG: DegT/DnrJ/EryC1/StrS aminotransferase family protein [Deinococcota bacterium]|nr:DegT/DnrJ/EryC1/StrS aminotransferase family protein [Deinococcota bacterium]
MSRNTFLSYSPPCIGEEEIAEVVATLRSDWITTGPKTKAFEQAWGSYVGAPGSMSVMLNSCTAGLHVAMVALDIGPGDEVIVPSLTFAATANVVEHVGARPVLVDILPDTLCIDPEAVRAAITPRTKGIIPVHYAGHPAELDEIFAIAEEFGLQVLEDAAHAVPTWYRGVMVGSRDSFASFSFYATKNLTTAEGGALTGHLELLERARVIGQHGMSKDSWKRFDRSGSWQYDIVMPGFKYNMTDIQASLGMHQLRRLEGFHKRRREIVRRYHDAFGKVDALQIPTERDYAVSSWHLYVLRVHPKELSINRDRFIEELKARNIGTSVHYRPLHMMSFYVQKYGYKPSDFPVTHDAFERAISLPLHPRLADKDVEDVIEAVLDVVQVYQRDKARF